MFNNIISLFSDIPLFLMRIPVILISLCTHEAAHAYIAYRQGDPTARNLGRMTLNPLKHLDPIGTVCMLLFGFGWAKPVPVNARNFEHPKRGMALTAFAGPVSNLILAFIGVLLYRILYAIFITITITSQFTANLCSYTLEFFGLFATLNVYLAVFNLIPVPPLDGSRLMLIFLPDKWYFGLMKYERIIMIVMMVLLFTGLLTLPLGWVAQKIIWLFDTVISFIPFL